MQGKAIQTGAERRLLEVQTVSAFWLGLKGAGEPVDGPSPARIRFEALMATRGLSTRAVHETSAWVLCLAGAGENGQEDWLRLPDGGFLAAVGVLLYRGLRQRAGLERLASDLAAGLDPEPHLAGTFALIRYQGGRLEIRGDQLGYYQIYADAAGEVFTSSLLACLPPTQSPRIAPQELYEYVLYGFCFGPQTPLADVRTAAPGAAWQLLPEPGRRDLVPAFAPLDATLSFQGMLEQVRASLLDYFAAVGAAFDGSLTCALSGGYDTRLMVATLRALGLAPKLYVYGGEQHPDVRVAKAIAAGEGLPLDHIDKSSWPPVPRERWRELVQRDWAVFDGLKATGIFDNGSDYETRRARAAVARLQLNGAGGEIYREIWHLPNRKLSIQDFLHARYDPGDFGFCTDRFRRGEFYAQLEAKVRALLGIERSWISRLELERLFPLLRNRFAGANTAINNQWGPSVLPFMEPRFVFPSYGIPIRFKEQGRFNAALIRSLDPALARYPSAYGWHFGGSPPLAARLRTRIQQQVPIAWRLSRRRQRYLGRSMPYYLSAPYLEELFGGRELAIREYLDPDRIHDPNKRARALTAELLFGGHLN